METTWSGDHLEWRPRRSAEQVPPAGPEFLRMSAVLRKPKTFKLRSLHSEKKFGVAGRSCEEVLRKGCRHLQVPRGAAGWGPPLAGWDRADPSSCGVGTGRVQAAPSRTVGPRVLTAGEDAVHHLWAESLSLTTADGHVPHPGLCPGSVLGFGGVQVPCSELDAPTAFHK